MRPVRSVADTPLRRRYPRCEMESIATDLQPAPPPARPLKPCDRCGTFAKRRKVLGQRLCAECLERRVHPAARGPIAAQDLARGAWGLTATIALPAIAIELVAHTPVVVFGLLAPNPTWVLLFTAAWSALVGPAVRGAVLHFGWSALRGRGVSWREAVGVAVTRWPALVQTHLVVSIVVMVSSLLIVPGVIAALDAQIAPSIALLEGRKGSAAFDLSKDRLRGSRLTVLGMLLLTAIPVQLLTTTIGVALHGPVSPGLASTVGAVLAAVLSVPALAAQIVLYARIPTTTR